MDTDLSEAKDASTEKDDDSRLSVGDLVRMFEAAEEATVDARQQSERDRDYVDNIQHTAAEIKELEKRGQPVVTDNRIKTKIDFLVGWEKQQRVDPRARPRTLAHEEDADGATEALRYVTQSERYAQHRSTVWRNMLVEGFGGIRVYAHPSKRAYGGMQGMMASTAMSQPEWDVKLQSVSWDRLFYDPHSSRPDFSDATYLGVVTWMDQDEALRVYGEGAREALESTMARHTQTETYDDRPRFLVWADKKRKRVRVVQMWINRGTSDDPEWHFAEFTWGGILKAGASPYKTDAGTSDCELFMAAAFINRENERYGYVREMISPQDEINKRRSKTLHVLNTAQVIAEETALSNSNDLAKVSEQAARPDGRILLAPGGLAGFQINTRADMAEGHFRLLQEAQNSIDLKGPNATMLGEKAAGSSAASGKAIIASQQGGMVSLGDLMDHLRDLDLRVFRAIWNRIRQYWTAPKWIRVTDDQRNLKWVGVNIDPMQLQMGLMQNPQMADKIAGTIGSVAELDCDIIIDEAPDNLTPQLEQLQALVELKKLDTQGAIPFRAIVETIPNLKNRQRFLQAMDEAARQPPPPPPELVKAQIDGQVKAQEAQQDAQFKTQEMAMQQMFDERKFQRDTARDDRKMMHEQYLKELEVESDIALAEKRADADIAVRTKTAHANAMIAASQAAQRPHARPK